MPEAPTFTRQQIAALVARALPQAGSADGASHLQVAICEHLLLDALAEPGVRTLGDLEDALYRQSMRQGTERLRLWVRMVGARWGPADLDLQELVRCLAARQ